MYQMIRKILLIIFGGLLVWLLVDAIHAIDFAPTKSRVLQREREREIDETMNMDSVKTMARFNIDRFYKARAVHSDLAIKHMRILCCLAVIQILLFVRYKKVNRS